MFTLGEIKAGILALSLAALVGWHFVDEHYAVKAAVAENDAKWQAQSDKAKADHDSAQKKADADAGSSNVVINAKVDAIARQTNAISGQLAALKPKSYAKALPVNCLFDDERVKDANDAIR